MFIKLKLKRNKFVKLTPENLKDIKEILCIKDISNITYAKEDFKKGTIYKFNRRFYNRRNKDCGVGFRLKGSWWFFGINDDRTQDHFVGKLINRRKKKENA